VTQPLQNPPLCSSTSTVFLTLEHKPAKDSMGMAKKRDIFLPHRHPIYQLIGVQIFNDDVSIILRLTYFIFVK
jgi:hypothetical protein